MIRTRFAPSPTGYMHIGNLRTALFEYLIAKHENGKFILRIEDTDQSRLVEGALDVIYNTLELTGLEFDEGAGRNGESKGDYAPYIQSQRKALYLPYAKRLVEEGKAYYCFCRKEDGDSSSDSGESDKTAFVKYDRRCYNLSAEEIAAKLQSEQFCIRQLIPDGTTTFTDRVFGSITIDNKELEDQILIKSDGFPTYNFANVVDDHAMAITHVVRGSEYLTSTPKYKLLYEAFGWQVPVYVHLPLMLNEDGSKISKRKGDASFQDLLAEGYLPEAIINYIAFLGWTPAGEFANREFFTLAELVEAFDIQNISKSPSLFDYKKLAWFNGEHIKAMPFDKFFALAEPVLRENIRTDVNLAEIAKMVQTRILFVKDIPELVDFIAHLADYPPELFTHKKMKTNPEIAARALTEVIPILENLQNWDNSSVYTALCELAGALAFKNSQVLWSVRTALSGKPSSPCGASELCALLGKDETLRRLQKGLEKFQNKPACSL